MTSGIVDTFAGHLVGLRRSLALMDEDQRLITMLTLTDELVGLYMEIASLNQVFHERCANGTLPRDRPLAGNA